VKKLNVVVLIAIAVSTANAQVALPSGPADHHLNREGDYKTFTVPYYSTGRVQYIYERSMLGKVSRIDKFAVRPDGSGSQKAVTVDWRLVFSSKGTPVLTTASKTSFKANLGTDQKVVSKRRLMSFPARSASPTKPMPFMGIPLDSPFVIDTNAKSLVIDILAFGSKHTLTSYQLDSTRDGRSRADILSSGRPACGGSVGNEWTEYFFSTNRPGSRFNVAMSAPVLKGQKYSLALAWVGRILPAPVNYPANTSCYLNVAPDLVQVVKYTGGFLSMDMGAVPDNPKLVGKKFPYQFGAYTQQGRLILSRGIVLTLNDGKTDHYGRFYSLGTTSKPWNPANDAITTSSAYSALVFRVN